MDHSNRASGKSDEDSFLTSSRKQQLDFTNTTIDNPPPPQAASTARPKAQKKSASRERALEDADCSYLNNSKHSTDFSSSGSLGIFDLENITASELLGNDFFNIQNSAENETEKSALSKERLLARKLLEQCTRPASSSKEPKNDLNRLKRLSELSSQQVVSSSAATSKDESVIDNNLSLAASVVFEPNEIAAMSSEMSNISDSSSSRSPQISFNSMTSEMMAQLANEEFQEGNSKLIEKLENELSFAGPNNALAAVPNENKGFDFSGIMGELNLTHESGNGSQMSIGDYFQKKCGHIGALSSADFSYSQRPSFGLNPRSPEKKGKPNALVDISVSTKVSENQENRNSEITTNSLSTNEQDYSTMNLSEISRILKDDAIPPQLFVDKLLAARKKKNREQGQLNKLGGETYSVLPSMRSSSASALVDIQMPEKDTTNNPLTKLSLATDVLPRSSNSSSKCHLSSKTMEQLRADGTIAQPLSLKNHREAENEFFISQLHRNSTSKITPPALEFSGKANQSSQNEPSPKFSSGNSTQTRHVSTSTSKVGIDEIDFNNKSLSTLQRVSDQKDTLSPVNKQNLEAMRNRSAAEISPNTKRNVIIGKKTQEVTACLVGVLTEAKIEVLNKGEKWILIRPSLRLIQREKEHIELRIPEETTLLNPAGCESIKIGVTIKKLCKPIMVGIDLQIHDMVTKDEWEVTHMMCFIPEEPKVDISFPGEGDQLDFDNVAEDGYKTLPVTIVNKNNIDVSINLQLVNNKPEIFFIEDFENETIKSAISYDGSLNLVLAPEESITARVELRGKSLHLLRNTNYQMERGFCRVRGKLSISVSISNDVGLVVQEIFLAGCIGVVKIEPIEMYFPFIVQTNQSKSFNIRNTGSISTSIHTMIVTKDEKTVITNKNIIDPSFSVMPDKFLLGCEEKGRIIITYEPESATDEQRSAFIKIIAGNSVYTYPIKGEKATALDHSGENCIRCDTPQSHRMTSPTSPHSAISYKTSGRESPGSSCSSAVTGDVIPIKATHSALVWGSLKAGKRDTKEFTIRNTSNHKIKLVASIEATDRSFKFFREGHGTILSIPVNLQGMESKTLSVIFEPNSSGAVAGKIFFNYYSQKKENGETCSPKVIQLYGYGGYGKLEIMETFKDTNGQLWLSLGSLNSEGLLEAKIKLRNVGDLPCYTKMDIIPKAVHPTMQQSWQVSPKEFILGPKQTQWISVDFRPKKNDLGSFKNDVSHVGTLKITYGDEPTRLRIRRLYSKMKETSQLHKKDDTFNTVIAPLCKAFPKEAFIQDLKIIRDSVQNLTELCQGINEHEVKLTMERNAEDMESFMSDNMDETATFHSLFNESAADVTYTGQSFMPSETLEEYSDTNNAQRGGFMVEPSSVTLMPPTVNETTVIMSSLLEKDQHFQCSTQSNDYISVVPCMGKIPAGKTVALKIVMKKPSCQAFVTALEIYTENHRHDIIIKVKDGNKQRHFVP